MAGREQSAAAEPDSGWETSVPTLATRLDQVHDLLPFTHRPPIAQRDEPGTLPTFFLRAAHSFMLPALHTTHPWRGPRTEEGGTMVFASEGSGFDPG